MPSSDTYFKAGNPGRPQGSKNKLVTKFLDVLYADFEKHGQEAVERMRAEKPNEYVRAVVQLMPKDLNINHSNEDLTDAELMRRARQIAEYLGPLAGVCGDSGGTEAEAGSESTGAVSTIQ